MTKDKETTGRSHWQKWRQSPTFFRNFSSYFIIIIILIFSIFILLYRHINKKTGQNDCFIPRSLPMPVPPSFKHEIAKQNSQLNHLENRFNQQQLSLQSCQQLVALEKLSLQSCQQLVALEILQEILEGRLPINTLTLYLQKQAEPWATNILSRLSPIKEAKTYDQLQVLLILPPSSQPLSRWQHVKNIIKSFVSIRQLDKEGQYTVGRLSDIQTALRTHNIQQALDAFAKLSPEERAQLSSWTQEAQDRLTLETIKKTMLLELSES